MGKVRTRVLGLEDLEEQQKLEQKKRSQEKKLEKKSADADSDTDVAAETATAVEEKAPMKKKESAPTHKHVVGKKHKAALKKVDNEKIYTLAEAAELLKKVKYAGFDESVEIHLNVDKEGLKGEVDLPHSMGKSVRVRIVDDALLADLEKGLIEFDILITHPSFMAKLAKYARTLGPKGLMPNPKAGTVSANPEEVAKKFEKGVMRWKAEAKFPLIHQMVAKSSAADEQIVENAKTFIQSVGRTHIRAAFMKTTMSPALRIDIEKL